jgi:hypothetical protein
MTLLVRIIIAAIFGVVGGLIGSYLQGFIGRRR